MTDAIVKRLEAVAAKLEAFAAGNGATSSTHATSTASSSAGPSAKLAAYDALYTASIQPFIDAANAVEGTKPVVSARVTRGRGKSV
jgi:hypothetical protein